jgi:spore germination cell wall hydrolase CwlJ-like protein
MIFKTWMNSWMLIALILGVITYQQTITASNDSTEITAIEDLKPIHGVDYRQVKCMATAIYYESSHEPRLGKIAVARVIQNRVRAGFGRNSCEVVYQKSQGVCQFSWSCDHRAPVNRKQCPECWSIATQVLARDQYQNYMRSALYFHATNINPKWANLRPIRVIGGHKFYRKG